MAEIVELYTGSTSWICPLGVTEVLVECWGGGGAGAGARGGGGGVITSITTGGGGGGAYSAGYVSVTPSSSYTIQIGAQRDGTTGEAADGNPSWFSSTTTIFAAGGGSGKLKSAGSGGQSSAGYGTIKYSGGDGYYVGENTPGGGGGGAGSTGNGGSSTSSTGGSGTSENGGNGGTGTLNPADGTITAGSIYGGGGGGVRSTNENRIGGNGAQGLIRLTYSTASTASQIKVWNGISWVEKPIKVYNGTSWVDANVKRWDGYSWVSI